MKTFNEIILAQELIRFPTIKTEDKGIMKFLSKKLSSIGFRCKIIKSKGTGPKPALNLYAKYGNSRPHIKEKVKKLIFQLLLNHLQIDLLEMRLELADVVL